MEPPEGGDCVPVELHPPPTTIVERSLHSYGPEPMSTWFATGSKLGARNEVFTVQEAVPCVVQGVAVALAHTCWGTMRTLPTLLGAEMPVLFTLTTRSDLASIATSMATLRS